MLTKIPIVNSHFSFRKNAAYAGMLLLLVIASLGMAKSAKAQVSDVYLYGGATHTIFLRKGDIQIDKTMFSPTFGLGLSFYMDEKQVWKIKTEIQYLGRDYNTYYPQSEFRFRSWGIVVNALAEYPLSEKLSLEAGIGVYLYGTVLLENGLTKRLGDQAKTIDLNLIAGISYQIHEPIYIGFRTTFGLIPMVTTKPVGAYGEMDGKKHLLNALTPELFVRVKLYREKKK